MNDRSHLLTEQRLEASTTLDMMDASGIVRLMHQQDRVAVEAVGRAHNSIAAAVELAATSLGAGGRLFYVGAGTSGRLGMLDAAECPPTFRSDPGQVIGIIAGGRDAMFAAKEGAEDRAEDGAANVLAHQLSPEDMVVGIAAGGTTPYVHGALRAAREKGAKTVFISCVQPVDNEAEVDVVIRLLTGPEVLTGSTRLKAGTATKLTLNMISTGAMVRLGKCYQNLMVDLKATNQKLWDRGARIISTVTQLDRDAAMNLLQQAQGHVKTAIIMHHRKTDLTGAQKFLADAGGHLRKAMG